LDKNAKEVIYTMVPDTVCMAIVSLELLQVV